VPVKLTPETTGSELKLTPEVGDITADGSLGELLKTGSLGDTLREKISRSILRALQKGANLKATLPPSIEAIAKIRTSRFTDSNGNLGLEMSAEVRMPEAELRSLIEHHN
jgi:hypothetical protein